MADTSAEPSPRTGPTPTLVTPNAPSYWHGFSPDGRRIAFVTDHLVP